jgi:hypothetical protein
MKKKKGRPSPYEECANALIIGTEKEVQCENRIEADSLRRAIMRKLPPGYGRKPRAVWSEGVFKVFMI